MSIGPGGGLHIGPSGGLYIGPTGPDTYFSNIPPRAIYLEELKKRGLLEQYKTFKQAWGL